MKASKNVKDRRHLNPGRPPVEAKKIPFQVMLDPRYIEHFRKTAKAKKVNPQDLARLALNAFVPDPFNPVLDPETLKPSVSGRRQ
jgi:hypothetical protein